MSDTQPGAPDRIGRGRSRLTEVFAAVAAGALVLVVVAAFSDGFSWRAGPVRVRLQDELRPFVIGVIALVAWRVAGARRSTAWRSWNVLAVLLAAAGALALARNAPAISETGDGAVLELYTLQARDAKLLVGPYSRFGWHHPGPLYMYAEVPWYVASGYRTAGMEAGALAINAAAVGATALTLARVASVPLAVAANVLLTIYVVRARDVVASDWNPHVIVLPLVAFLVLAATVASGTRRSLVWLVLVASFLLQTHIATGPIVVSVGLIAAIAGLARVRRADPARAGQAIRTLLNRAAWVLAALWLLPLVDQLTRTPGNATRIWRFFLSAQGGQPAATAFAVWASTLLLPFRGGTMAPIGIRLHVEESLWPVVAASVAIALVAVSAAAAFRRSQRWDGWLAIGVLVATLIALVSVRRIPDAIFDHEVFWMSALGVVAGAVVLALPLAHWKGWATRSLAQAAALMTCATIVTVGAAELTARLNRPAPRTDADVKALTRDLTQYLREHHARLPLVRVHLSVWETSAGVLLQLYKSGIPFSVDENSSLVFGDALTATGREDVELVFAGSREHESLAARPANTVVAHDGNVFIDAMVR